MRGIIIIPLALLICGCLGDYDKDYSKYIHHSLAAAHFNDVASRLYQRIAENEKGNFAFSPMSVSITLSMLLNATYLSTHKELVELLFHAGIALDVHKNIKPLIEEFNNFTKVDLKLANKIFLSNTAVLNPQFKDAALETVDFEYRYLASRQINEWCKKQTNSKIENVVTPRDIIDNTLMVLLNAVYFKGNWAQKFQQALPRDSLFRLENGTYKNVPTMNVYGEYGVANIRNLNARVLRLPYENEDKNDGLSMYIILPDDSSKLEELERKLHNLRLFDLSRMEVRQVAVFLPKFKIESSIDLKSPLIKLGLKTMFTPAANFERLTSSQVEVTKFSQKAFMEVNEEGSEAAAITMLAFGFRILQDARPFIVDRPFISLIATNHSILFMARIVDP